MRCSLPREVVYTAIGKTDYTFDRITLNCSSPCKMGRRSIRCFQNTSVRWTFPSHRIVWQGKRGTHSPALRCHPRVRLRDAAPLAFSAREENLETEEEGSVRLAAAWSGDLGSIRTARELSAGVSWISLKERELLAR